MWRVLVADDEPVILSGIKRFIEECDCNCEIIAEANDGIEAIEMIEKHNPDIVVSDIQMPGATGLDIIKRYYDNDNCPKFIFVSGYDEFKYVQEALRYDAVDYLLKPVTGNEIKEILVKTINKLSNRNKFNVLKSLDEDVVDFFKDIEEKDKKADSEILNKFKEVNIDIVDSFFVGVCFNINFEINSSEKIQYEKKEFKKFIIYDYIYNYYKSKKIGLGVKKDDLGCQMILVIPNRDRNVYMSEYILPLKNQIELEHNIKLQVGVGEVIEKVCDIRCTLDMSKIASQLYFFIEEDIIFYDMFRKKNNKKMSNYTEEVEFVIKNLVLRNGEILEHVKKVIEVIGNINYGSKKDVINRSCLFIEQVYIQIKNYNLDIEELQKLKNKVVYEVNSVITFSELKKIIIEYFVNIKEIIDRDESIRDKVEIARVKNYIKENYSQEITLKMLADMIGMNLTYFSVFFKKNVGENYISYITKVRMKEAHRLLMSTDMLIYEIAESVGYNTVRRFSEAFRKVYGLNPMEYKKNNL